MMSSILVCILLILVRRGMPSSIISLLGTLKASLANVSVILSSSSERVGACGISPAFEKTS